MFMSDDGSFAYLAFLLFLLEQISDALVTIERRIPERIAIGKGSIWEA